MNSEMMGIGIGLALLAGVALGWLWAWAWGLHKRVQALEQATQETKRSGHSQRTRAGLEAVAIELYAQQLEAQGALERVLESARLANQMAATLRQGQTAFDPELSRAEWLRRQNDEPA